MATLITDLTTAIRENLLERLEGEAVDAKFGRFPNSIIINAFNRAVKVALAYTKRSKQWYSTNVINGQREYNLPTLEEVQAVKYNGTLLHPMHEVDAVAIGVVPDTSITRYVLQNEPATTIVLDGTPDSNITDGLKIYAFIFPDKVGLGTGGEITGNSPLHQSYDEFLIHYTSFLLIQADEDTSESVIYRDAAFQALSTAFNIERPKFDKEKE